MTKETHGSTVRISNSFSEGEITVMHFIMSTLLRGGDPKTVVRNRHFASLFKKVLAMKEGVERKTGKPVDPFEPLVPATEEGSSVVARVSGDSVDEPLSA